MVRRRKEAVNGRKSEDNNVKSPRTPLLRVGMTLRDVLYLNYTVPPSELRRLVPAVLPLAVAGDDRAFLSVVALRSTRVRLNLFPFLRFDYFQLNIRTYVTDPLTGRPAVYFLQSGVTSRFISGVTRLAGIPWQSIVLQTESIPAGDGCRYRASGSWNGSFSVEARVSSAQSGQPPLFEDRRAAVDFLIRPLIGFIGNGRRLGRFTIRHPEVSPGDGALVSLDFPLLESLGVVAGPESPHSVFWLPEAGFSIYLPPAGIKQRGG